MEQQPFTLEKALTNWRERLSSRGIAPEVIEELETHLVESASTLRETGLSEAEAFHLAVERLGEPSELAAPSSPLAADPKRASTPGCGRRLGIAFLVVGLLLIVLALAGPVLTYLLPRKYVSASTIQVRAGSDQARLRAEMEIIRGPKVLGQVVADLGLAREWNLSPEAASAALSTMLSLTPIRSTDLLKIEIKDTDPRRAADLANKISQTYVALPENSAKGGGESPPTHRAVIHELAVASEHPASPRLSRIMTVAVLLGLAGFGLLILGLILIMSARKRTA